jgi:autotransporter-associated beta strand protein
MKDVNTMYTKSPQTTRALSAITLIFTLLTSSALAATKTWDGGQTTGASGNRDKWTSSGNWDANTLPLFNGTEDIIFASGFANGLTSTDLNGGKAILSLTITTATSFVIRNDATGALTNVSGNLTRTGAGTATITANLILGGASYTGIWSNGNAIGQLVLSNVIAEVGGARSITLNGIGTNVFAGSSANTYSGATTVNGGTLVLAKTAGINAIAGALVIGDGTGTDTVRLGAANQIANTSAVTVNNSGVFNLNNFSDQIGSLSMTAGSVLTGTGRLILGGNVTGNAHGSSATVGGNLDLGGATRTFTIADGGAAIDMQVSAVVSNGGLVKAGLGTLELTGANKYAGGTTISDGTLRVNNTTGSGTGTGAVIVEAGGTLGGTGSVSGALTVNAGGILAPGNSVGTLQLGSLDLVPSSTLQIELASLSSYDKLVLTGSTTLGGDLDVVLLGGYTPDLGDSFTILSAAGGVSGSFDSITEGYSIELVGNDVVLTVVPEPSAWALAVFGILMAAITARRRR